MTTCIITKDKPEIEGAIRSKDKMVIGQSYLYKCRKIYLSKDGPCRCQDNTEFIFEGDNGNTFKIYYPGYNWHTSVYYTDLGIEPYPNGWHIDHYVLKK